MVLRSPRLQRLYLWYNPMIHLAILVSSNFLSVRSMLQASTSFTGTSRSCFHTTQFDPTEYHTKKATEIRLQIYHLTIPQNSLIDGENPTLKPRDCIPDSPAEHQNSLLFLNKQISSEALNILYGSNIFHLVYHDSGESHLQQNFSSQNLQRMRKIAITAGSYGGCYHTSKRPDEKLWSLLLPNLSMLRFIVDQPLEFDSRYWESYDYECSLTLEEKDGLRRTFQGKLARWIGWIGGIAEFFGASIDEGTRVEVDVNGLVETKELFARYLPRFEEVHDIELGDYMFKRGRYSREMGYNSGEEWSCSLFD